jgi:hypothetical protein
MAILSPDEHTTILRAAWELHSAADYYQIDWDEKWHGAGQHGPFHTNLIVWQRDSADALEAIACAAALEAS